MQTTKNICSLGIWDKSIPGISFDENGLSNYAKMSQRLVEAYPRGEKGKEEWNNWVSHIKHNGKNKKYDCIIGVSGGTDSSYLLFLANKCGFRPLAVNLDNGWSSQIAVKNIKLVTNALNIDLETYVIDYEEVKAVLRSFIKASLPWIDGPTDLAIKAVLYKIASREKIRLLKDVVNRFEKLKLKTYPYYTLQKLFYYGYVKKIKMIRPYYYVSYNKREAQEFLKKEFNWEYYGGHHHENLFTKFAIACWLPRKFGIDKRIITLSAQILSGEISRDEALEEIKEAPYDLDQMERDKELVLHKLDFSKEEFERLFHQKNSCYTKYSSYMPLYTKYYKLTHFIFKHILPFTPPIFTELEIRKNL